MAGTSRNRVRRTHRDAVSRMLRATGLTHVADEAPLVAFLKECARELDENPGSTRVMSAYLSALKDVRKVLDAAVAAPKKSAQKVELDPLPDEPTADVPENVSSLDEFLKERGVTA